MQRKCLLLCFVSLLLFPPDTASADLLHDRNNFTVLNTISNLSNVEFGSTFPRHGLSLLHHIAHHLQIDPKNNILADFNPSRSDFGFQAYHNDNNVFPRISDENKEAYHSVGNIIPENPGSTSLLPYVTWAYYQTNSPHRNRDRIVIRFNNDTQQVQEIYITQKTLNCLCFDSTHTYRISVNLLREIQNQDSYEDFLDQAGRVRGCVIHRGRFAKPLAALDNARGKQCPDIKLQVRTTNKGYARMRWDNIPLDLLNVGAKLELYKDTSVLESLVIEEDSYGFKDTKQYLNPGLQLRLVTKDDVISQSPKLDDAYWSLPTNIPYYEASLQLYTKDGWASARLYIKKSFTDWKKLFENSWVGFYHSYTQGDDKYKKFKWATCFTLRSFNFDYDVYEYQSEMPLSPGAQARFFLTKEYYLGAATVPWERASYAHKAIIN